MADAALVLSGVLMGAAGVPHCVAMCGSTSVVALQRCTRAKPGGPALGFHAGRVLGYALAGAVVASGTGLLESLARASPMIRPLWTLVQVAAFAMGLWLLLSGRQPAWFAPRPPALAPALVAGGWQRLAGPAQTAALGMAWVAWPCGLLQSALVVSALASTAWAGAAVMGGFAMASSPGLWASGLLWTRGLHPSAAAWAIRLSGACLVLAAGWALGHGLWEKVVALCG